MRITCRHLLLTGFLLFHSTAIRCLSEEDYLRLNRTNLLQFIDDHGSVAAVRSLQDWARRRASILAAMQSVMGPLPKPERRCPLDVRVLEEADCQTYLRRFITYESEPGSRVPAYLLIPKQAMAESIARPGILCLHQTHQLGQKVVVGLGNSPNDEYGVELVQRGYVCLAPAYPLLANYQPDLKALGYESGTMKAIWDNIRGLDFLEELPFVIKGRFAAIGHSLGGHNAIFTAAFDHRIQIIVSSCGLDMFRDYMGGQIKGWTSERYMPKLARYSVGALPFDFAEIIGVLAPRVCLISAPTGDTNFKWWSVDALANATRPIYDLSGRAQDLHVEHPDCGHLFPKEERELAYKRIDEQLHRDRP